LKYKKVCFRVDGSDKIGSGHISRCLAFADFLKKKKIESFFIIRNFNGNFATEIKKKGFRVFKLKKKKKKVKKKINHKIFFYKNSLQQTEEIDALDTLKILTKIKPCLVFVDHYGISEVWHRIIKSYKYKLVVIDDLADRKYYCDLLIDSTHKRKKSDYKNLINSNCQLLLGADKSFIKDEFLLIRKKSFKKNLNNIKIKNILITMGNSDPLNTTFFVVRSILKSPLNNLTINILLGKSYKFKKSILKIINKDNKNFNLINYTNKISEYALKADFAVTTPSVTSLELMTIGLPMGVIINAKNQNEIAKNFEKDKVMINFGLRKKLTFKRFTSSLVNILFDYKKCHNMIKAGTKICSGKGKLIVYRHMLQKL
jgi:UDP-2,4-diacetamido-2,4,6-trideoxy-beta-L-altropyranose hydrolase